MMNQQGFLALLNQIKAYILLSRLCIDGQAVIFLQADVYFPNCTDFIRF